MCTGDFMQKRLYELRKSKNITQQRLAIDLGIDQTSISSYECGKYLPTVEVLIKLAEYFGVSTDYILGLSDLKTPPKAVLDDQAAYLLSTYETLSNGNKNRLIGYAEALRDQGIM
jgi:transcriptional regulator with XRE-family HTH domain